jgi:signal transduction histidine kinase
MVNQTLKLCSENGQLLTELRPSMIRHKLPYALIALVAFGLGAAVYGQWTNALEAAKQDYVTAVKNETRSDVRQLDFAIGAIRDNIRMVAAMPSVRNIDRYGLNFSAEAKLTVQEIYNNLASSVAVSEVYIVPIDLEPDRIDPTTLKREEPILMFDSLIANASDRTKQSSAAILTNDATVPQVETAEYLQLTDHAAWLSRNFATIARTDANQMPFISGPEVITCDNTKFEHSGQDADRKGIIFSTPFYGMDGKIKGLVSAVILTDALTELLPKPHFALVNPGHKYANFGDGVAQNKSWHYAVHKASPDLSLIYSEVVALSVLDSRSPWVVWAGLPDAVFVNSAVVAALTDNRNLTWFMIDTIALAGAIGLALTRKAFERGALAAQILSNEKDVAKFAVAAAHLDGEHLKKLNESVVGLNAELASKVKALESAQDEIVRRSKMTQLGQLTATVAHELRNPLAGLRTSAYLLRRKIENADYDVDGPLRRIEFGVSRCDAFVSQLLDYTHSQAVETKPIIFDEWLEELLHAEASKLNAAMVLSADLGLGDRQVQVDEERLGRAIINLISNASEAMLGRDGVPAKDLKRTPNIHVSTTATQRGIEICVHDNGPGIPSHMIEKIREPLYTTKSFGTGLGIPAIEKIAEMHGGGLDIVSGFGEGARFTIWLRPEPMPQNIQVAA